MGKKSFLKKGPVNKQEKVITPQRFDTFSSTFLRRRRNVEETSKKRAFFARSCISDDISDDISADNFVLVVHAREYKTREKQKGRRREESIVLLPPLQRLHAASRHLSSCIIDA